MDLARRLALAGALVAAIAAPVSAQDTPITLPAHVIVDSCSGCGSGAITIADGADTNAGTTTDAAVVGDVSGTLSGKVRGFSKIWNDVWDSAAHRIKVDGSGVTLTIAGAVTQGAAPWSFNWTQAGGVGISTGYGPAGSGVPRVTASADDTFGSTTFSASAGATGASCPAASATAVTSNTSCLVIPLAGQVGVATDVLSGTLAATTKFEQSFDGGSTWATSLVLVNGSQGSSAIFTNPNPETSTNWYLPQGASHVRMYVSSYTSGSATVWGRATKIVSPLAVGAISSTVPGLPVPSFSTYVGGQARTSLPTANANGALTGFSTDPYGEIFAREDHLNRVHCVVAVSTATTIQAVGGSCVAPGASLSLYITDIHFGASAAGGVAADSFPTLKYGTTGTCGTGTTVFWQALTVAGGPVIDSRRIPIKIPANNEVCWIMTTAGSKTLQLGGFIAP